MPVDVIEKFYMEQPPVASSESTKLLLQALFPLLHGHDGDVFLDIGCYDGEKTALLGSWIRAKHIIGIDWEGTTLHSAKSRMIEAIAVNLNKTERLPFASETIDVIHAGEILEHLYSPDVLLAEIHRVLRKTGYAILTTPNLASWRNRFVLLLGWQPFGTEVSTRYKLGNPRNPKGPLAGHIRLFTPRAIRELCGKYQLRVCGFQGWASGLPKSKFTWMMSWIDLITVRFFPDLCDGIILIIRARKEEN